MTKEPMLPQDNTGAKTQVLGLEPNVAGLLCYLPFVGLIASIVWVVTEPKSNKFVRFYAMQSLALTVVGFVISAAVNVLALVGLGSIAGILSTIISLGMLAVCIICAVKAWKGETFVIPVIGEFAASKS